MRLMSNVEYKGFKRGKQKGIQEGRQEGLAAGEQKGLLQGRKEAGITMLKCLLQAKFKTVPQHYYRQIAQAQPDNLLQWIQRVLSSQSLEEVFKP